MNISPETTDPQVCPVCGSPLSGGLCPRCLMADAAQATLAPGLDAASAPPSLAQVAAAFPQLEIIDLIGAGGMGTVWRARQPTLNRFVALKLLPASINERDPAFAERFAREGQLLARLHHPNIVTVHDSGRAGEFFYLLMEFVDGVNLRQAMRASRFTAQQALAIVPKICDALQYAHEEGVLHRDIKPENILLDAKGRVKLVDFGIAKLMAQPENLFIDAQGQPKVVDFGVARTREPGEADSDSGLTLRGTTLGTPQYMAPEQVERPAEVDNRADIYSLGVVFYELLTGELPVGKFAPPSQRSEADPRVDGIVQQAMQKERERRQGSVGEFRTQVLSVTSNSHASGPATRVLKSSVCHITTPEHLATWWGKIMYIATGKGRIVLDEQRLVCKEDAAVTVVPLSAIRSLSTGEYSRWAKPTGLDYISVVYEEGGELLSLCFTPKETGFQTAWDTNLFVAEWLEAIRDAVVVATGHAPDGTPPKTRPKPGRGMAAWLWITFPAFVVAAMNAIMAGNGHWLSKFGEMAVIVTTGMVLFVIVVAGLPWLIRMVFNARGAGPAVAAGVTLPPGESAASSGAGCGSYDSWEYRSARSLFGLPLLHVAIGNDPATCKMRVARGVLAVGGIAEGIIAFGARARGVFAFGGVAIGVVAVGGLSIGLISMGGLAIGLLLTFGGLAMGTMAVGGGAVGWYAFGGTAIGEYAAGGTIIARHAIEQVKDMPWVLRYVARSFHWIVAAYVLLVGVMSLAPVMITRWARRKVMGGPPPSPVAACVAMVFAILSGVLGTLTWFQLPDPPQVLVFSILVSALIGAALGALTRKSWLGRQALMFGCISTAIWVFIWLISSYAAPVHSSAKEAATFGPVIERVISVGNQSDSFYSIDKESYVAGPKDFKPLPEPGDSSDEATLTVERLSRWATENDVDFLAQRNHGALLLSLVSMLSFSCAEEDFAKRSADDLLHDPAFHELANKQLRPSLASPLTASRPGGLKTMAFQTRYERFGMVQVVGVSSSPPSVTIRYKLVQPKP